MVLINIIRIFVGLVLLLAPFTIAWSSGAAKIESSKDISSYTENIEKPTLQQDDSTLDNKNDPEAGISSPEPIYNELEKLPVVETPADKVLEILASVADTGNNVYIGQTQQPIQINREVDFVNGDLILTNKWTSLPETFIPEGIVRVADKNKEIKLECTYSGLTVRKEVRDAIITMFKAAKDSGINRIIITSGYRSYDYQKILYNNKVNSLIDRLGKQAAQQQASEIVATPGTSEHQTGLAIDITTPELLKTADPLVSAFGDTEQGKWIYENSWKYGFIVRYQPDKKDITGIVYEPWHLRYVGIPHAEIMFKNNWCLEEYHEQLKKVKHIAYATEDKSYDIFYTSVPLAQEVFSEIYNDQAQYEISGDGRDGYIITIANDIYK